MIYFKRFNTEAEHEAQEGHPEVIPMTCLAVKEDIVHYHNGNLNPITVQGLIDAGYATVDASGHIQILSNSPYPMNLITDFIDVLTNNKKVKKPNSEELCANNSFQWSEALPANWTAQELADVYTNNPLNLGLGTLSGDYNSTPRFYGVDFTGVNSMTITMNGGSWSVIAKGIFNEGRGNLDTRTWENCPETVNFILTGAFSSVAQVPFTAMLGTKHLTISCPDFGCHDISGFFEYSSDLEDITFLGKFNYNAARNINNMFHNCNSLREVPLGNTAQDRYTGYNVIYARRDSWRGTPTLDQLFMNCEELTKINPTLNLYAAWYGDMTVNGGTFYNCNKLTDIRMKNLNNSDFDFATNVKASIPNIDVESINYLLNNVASQPSIRYAQVNSGSVSVETGYNSDGTVRNLGGIDQDNGLWWTDSNKTQMVVKGASSYPEGINVNNFVAVSISDVGGFTITLPALHQSEVDASAIASAQAKGWTVNFA